jgi:hypothetical protein
MDINLKDIKNLEAVLVPDSAINESHDGRRGVGDSGDSRYYVKDYFDWRTWSSAGFGQSIASSLVSLGKGYSAEVTDMGDSCAIRVSYHNTGNGKGVERTFIILFSDPKKGDGRIMITSTKWRTFSSYTQVASYISGVIRGYSGETNGGSIS